MMNLSKRFAKRTFVPMIAALCALTSSSCGSTDSSFDSVGGGGFPVGSPSSPVHPGNFYNLCAQRGGVVIQYPDLYCRIVRSFGWTLSSSSFPYLTPSAPAGFSAAPPANQAFHVRPGDRLIVQATAQSGWGTVTTSTKSYLGGFFNISSTSWSCNAIRLNGKAEGSSATTYNEGLPAGFVGSIGGGAPFLIGHSFNRILEEEGPLRFGFNAPVDQNTVGLCHSTWFDRFEIQRCENNQGQSITCP